MLILARSRVDDGHRPLGVGEDPGHPLGQSARLCAHDDAVEVGAEGAHGIVLGLALAFTGGGRVAHGADPHTEDLTGRMEREEGTRTGLREIEHRTPMRQHALQEGHALLALSQKADARGQIAQRVQRLTPELLSRQHMKRPALRVVQMHTLGLVIQLMKRLPRDIC